MGKYRFREAAPSDAHALGAVHVESWRETYAGLLPEAMLTALKAEEVAAMWRGILEAPAEWGMAGLFVAEAAGRIVGFGACCAQRSPALASEGYAGEIAALYVRRAHQGEGAGRALMRLMAGRLVEAGCRGAALWVLRDNRPACAFYETLGAPAGERTEVQSGTTLVERAYGWRDLTLLAG